MPDQKKIAKTAGNNKSWELSSGEEGSFGVKSGRVVGFGFSWMISVKLCRSWQTDELTVHRAHPLYMKCEGERRKAGESEEGRESQRKAKKSGAETAGKTNRASCPLARGEVLG